MGRDASRDAVRAALVALGTAVLLLPLAIAWLIGSTERRQWVISGPAPFCYLGSGPLLVWIGLGALVLELTIAYALRRMGAGGGDQ